MGISFISYYLFIRDGEQKDVCTTRWDFSRREQIFVCDYGCSYSNRNYCSCWRREMWLWYHFPQIKLIHTLRVSFLSFTFFSHNRSISPGGANIFFFFCCLWSLTDTPDACLYVTYTLPFLHSQLLESPSKQEQAQE